MKLQVYKKPDGAWHRAQLFKNIFRGSFEILIKIALHVAVIELALLIALFAEIPLKILIGADEIVFEVGKGQKRLA